MSGAVYKTWDSSGKANAILLLFEYSTSSPWRPTQQLTWRQGTPCGPYRSSTLEKTPFYCCTSNADSPPRKTSLPAGTPASAQRAPLPRNSRCTRNTATLTLESQVGGSRGTTSRQRCEGAGGHTQRCSFVSSMGYKRAYQSTPVRILVLEVSVCPRVEQQFSGKI